jgi:virginiamycin A acetyltransferase
MLCPHLYARLTGFLADLTKDPASKSLPRTVRVCCRLTAAALAAPVALPFILLGRFADWIDRYAEVAMALSRVPFYFGEYVRLYFYKATLEGVGHQVTFKYGSYCQYRSAKIGNNVLIGQYCSLGEITIGSGVLMGGFVNCLSGTEQHSFSDPDQSIDTQPATGPRRINVGSDVWIGSNCVICDDVGDRCVVGVGSLVISPLAAHGLYVGHPARFVKHI